ncbi:MAG: hypothetical protein AB4352_23685 [Hormoscilla sp.]
MNQPLFQAMNQKELQAYMLSHRDDDEAFYAYVDRLHAEGKWGSKYPPLKSLDDLKNYPEFLEQLSRDPGRQVSNGDRSSF